MAGMTGRFVQLVARGDQFDIVSDPSVDLSLNPLLQRLFPLIRAHISVAQYIEEASALDRGLVSHALCAALRNLLKACARLDGQASCACMQVNSSLQSLGCFVSLSSGVLGTSSAAGDAVQPGRPLAPAALVLRAAVHGDHADVRRA